MTEITTILSNVTFFKLIVDHLAATNNPHNVTAEQLGLTDIEPITNAEIDEITK